MNKTTKQMVYFSLEIMKVNKDKMIKGKGELHLFLTKKEQEDFITYHKAMELKELAFNKKHFPNSEVITSNYCVELLDTYILDVDELRTITHRLFNNDLRSESREIVNNNILMLLKEKEALNESK